MSNKEGKHEIRPMPFEYGKVKEVMDEETYKWHHDTHYAGYVNKRNEIEKELGNVDLGKANVNFSVYRALKVDETWNANGSILHEVYWNAMGGDGKVNENLSIIKKMIEDFGSFDAWKNDFIACGKSGRGWSVLSFDLFSDKKLRNLLYDFHNVGGVAGSIPLVAVDLYEHAYYHRYGPDRATYLTQFVNNIDWNKVDKSYSKYARL
jgi:Fe-Mn family superoxide dismutase